MKRYKKFITKKEKESLAAAQGLSCCTFGSHSNYKPIGNPQEVVEELRIKYKMPEGTGIDLSNGEFVSP